MTIIYVDMDGVLCDYITAATKAIVNNPAIQFPQSQYGFFTKLDPIQNAIRSYKRLCAHLNFDVYILTKPSYQNPLCYTEKRMWVEKYLGFTAVENLIICGHKNLLIGEYLIDDFIDGAGQDKFLGTHIHFGSSEYPNWYSIMQYFEKKYDVV